MKNGNWEENASEKIGIPWDAKNVRMHYRSWKTKHPDKLQFIASIHS